MQVDSSGIKKNTFYKFLHKYYLIINIFAYKNILYVYTYGILD